uniref:Orf171 n=1 Tax=Batis maritima TaxID=4436 RepID=A0A068BBQ6_BATMA|nr:orf171 [Batis maritima]AIC83360.1 orf171 [Batis maritima]
MTCEVKSNLLYVGSNVFFFFFQIEEVLRLETASAQKRIQINEILDSISEKRESFSILGKASSRLRVDCQGQRLGKKALQKSCGRCTMKLSILSSPALVSVTHQMALSSYNISSSRFSFPFLLSSWISISRSLSNYKCLDPVQATRKVRRQARKEPQSTMPHTLLALKYLKF